MKLVEQNEFGVGADLSGKVNFVLADLPFSARRHWKYDHAEYEVVRFETYEEHGQGSGRDH